MGELAKVLLVGAGLLLIAIFTSESTEPDADGKTWFYYGGNDCDCDNH